jgi:hypothetical protein
MGSGKNVGFWGVGATLHLDLRPGWCRGPEGAALCPPHTLRCRGSGVRGEIRACSALNGERDG